jgi:PAS domain-containing protein/ActR/RegA family two-component response regulator
MATLQTRLVLALALVGGAPLLAKTAIELSRLDAPIATEIGTRAQAALLEAAPAVEHAYLTGDRDGLNRIVRAIGTTPRLLDAVVVDPHGIAIASTASGLEGKAADATPLGPALRLASAAGAAGAGVRFASEKGAVYAALPIQLARVASHTDLIGPPSPADPSNGVLLARFDLAGATAAARQHAIESNVALALALLALLIVAGVVVNTSLGAPARRMAKAIERFDLGERGARTNLAGRDELGPVGRAFDTLAENLQALEADLLETRARLEVVLKCVPVGVMIVRRDDGRPIYVNARWKELFGIPMDASRDILSLLSTVRCERADGTPYPLEQLPIPLALRTGRPVEERELRVRRDDAVITLQAGAVPVSLWRDDTFDAVVAVVSAPDGALVPSVPQRREPVAVTETATPVMPVAVTPAPPPAVAQNQSSDRALTEAAVESESADQALTEAAVESESADRALAENAVEPLGLLTSPADAEPEDFPDEVENPQAVLVIEGEAELRDLAERALTAAGYRPFVTGDPAEAMTFARGESLRLAIAVIDLWVPGTAGGPLLDELLDFDPTLRVVAASGYRPDMPVLAASGKVTSFLPKPYGEERLLATVAQALESEPALGISPTPIES